MHPRDSPPQHRLNLSKTLTDLFFVLSILRITGSFPTKAGIRIVPLLAGQVSGSTL
jgi:hypothetical protein